MLFNMEINLNQIINYECKAGVWGEKKIDLKMSEHGILEFCSAQHFLASAVSTTKIPNQDSECHFPP